MNERLDEMKLNEKDAKEYKRYLKGLRDIASEQHTKMVDAQDLIKQGVDKGIIEERVNTVIKLHKKGKSNQEISDLLDLSIEEVVQIIDNHNNK